MARKITRREFVRHQHSSRGGGRRVNDSFREGSSGPDRQRQAGGRGVEQRQRLQERRRRGGRAEGVQPDHQGRRRARRADRRRQPLRAGSGRHQRRLRRPAERRRHRAARLVLHARPDQARRRRGGARRRAHAVAGGEGGDGDHRSSPAGRQGRAGLRPQHGIQDRRRSQHREVARRCGSNGSGASIRSTTSIRRSAARRCRWPASAWCATA